MLNWGNFEISVTFSILVGFCQYFGTVFTDSNTSPTEETGFLRTGLANLNPQEGHITRIDSPEGHTCVYIYRNRGMGIEFTTISTFKTN